MDVLTNIIDGALPLYLCDAGVGVLEGPLYAVGGHDGWSYLSTAERLDPETRQWTYVAPMFTARSTVGVAVVLNKLVTTTIKVHPL